MTSCTGLINSGRIPSLPGDLPETKLSMALLRSSIDGSESGRDGCPPIYLSV